MQPTDLSLEHGNVRYWDMDRISDAEPIQCQLEHLKEDLAQIEYESGSVIDIGWYPSFDPTGEFIVVVIKNEDWESPLFLATANDIPTLQRLVQQALEFV